MIPWLQKFFWDESIFERVGRTLVFGLGTAITTGLLNVGPKFWWFGQAIQVAALMIGAGDKNVPPKGNP